MGPFENASPVTSRPTHFATRTQQAHAQTLAGWISLLAEDRGLDARGLAAETGLEVDEARAVLRGIAAAPVPALDRALRRLEGRSH